MPLTDRKYSKALAYASGTADRPGAALDMSGFDEVDMVVVFAAIAADAVTSVKAQCDDVASFAGAVDIAGTAQTVAHADDDDVFIIHIAHPPKRYVRVFIDKDASNASGESAVYVQHKPGYKPQSSDVATSIRSEAHVWPAVGTA